LQALLGKAYTKTPLKKYHISEMAYEPLRKHLLLERENRVFITIVSEEMAKKQGALYRTLQNEQLLVQDPKVIATQRAMADKLARST
jgi:hypothetical protein